MNTLTTGLGFTSFQRSRMSGVGLLRHSIRAIHLWRGGRSRPLGTRRHQHGDRQADSPCDEAIDPRLVSEIAVEHLVELDSDRQMMRCLNGERAILRDRSCPRYSCRMPGDDPRDHR
jgi:hypothetical protein